MASEEDLRSSQPAMTSIGLEPAKCLSTGRYMSAHPSARHGF